MSAIVKQADSKGRVVLPGFANATLIVEKISPAEYRVKRAKVIPEDELQFQEEAFPKLSAEAFSRFLDVLDNPPPPSQAALAAAKEFVKTYGHPLDDRKAESKPSKE